MDAAALTVTFICHWEGMGVCTAMRLVCWPTGQLVFRAGGFGKVYAGEWHDEAVAIKLVSQNGPLVRSLLMEFQREVPSCCHSSALHSAINTNCFNTALAACDNTV